VNKLSVLLFSMGIPSLLLGAESYRIEKKFPFPETMVGIT